MLRLIGMSEEVFHGRLYPNLETLVEKGPISKGDRDSESR